MAKQSTKQTSSSIKQKPIPVYGSADQITEAFHKMSSKKPQNNSSPNNSSDNTKPANQTLNPQQPLNKNILTVGAVISVAVLLIIFLISNKNLDNIFNKDWNQQAPLPSKLEALISGTTNPKLLSRNEEMAIWYYPDTKDFWVVISADDEEATKQKAYDWFRGYGADEKSGLKINFNKLQTIPAPRN